MTGQNPIVSGKSAQNDPAGAADAVKTAPMVAIDDTENITVRVERTHLTDDRAAELIQTLAAEPTSSYAVRELGDATKDQALAAIPVLLNLLRRDESDVRLEIKQIVGELVATYPEALPSVINAFRSDSPLVRAGAASIIGWADGMLPLEEKRCRAAIPALNMLLNDPVFSVRLEAAKSLSEYSDDALADRALPILQEALRPGKSDQPGAVAHYLGNFGVRAAPAIPELSAVVRGEDPFNAAAAIATLGHIGPEAASAAPDVADAMRRFPNVDSVQQNGAWALRKFGTVAES